MTSKRTLTIDDSNPFARTSLICQGHPHRHLFCQLYSKFDICDTPICCQCQCISPSCPLKHYYNKFIHFTTTPIGRIMMTGLGLCVMMPDFPATWIRLLDRIILNV